MADKDYDSDQAPETIIGATVKVEGDLVSEGDVKVDGFVTGKIKTSKNLYIGPMAKIEADVEAANAELSGVVKGNLKLKEGLILSETGKLNGDVFCTRLAIAQGAHFSGSCTMPEEKEELKKPLPEEEE